MGDHVRQPVLGLRAGEAEGGLGTHLLSSLPPSPVLQARQLDRSCGEDANPRLGDGEAID